MSYTLETTPELFLCTYEYDCGDGEPEVLHIIASTKELQSRIVSDRHLPSKIQKLPISFEGETVSLKYFVPKRNRTTDVVNSMSSSDYIWHTIWNEEETNA